MTRTNDIIRMAREADIDWHKHWNDDESNRLEVFAALVAADEREACAVLCDQLSDSSRDLRFGAAIRERGQA
jgi:hypothetical protein